ncbi:MAG: ATP-binding domain-containing protein [Gallionella sp.]
MERIPASQLLDWVFEFGKEQRHAVAGKLTLSTVHGAKGREFKHVILLDGGWQAKPNQTERRLYYVGMTRAEQTLTLFEFDQGANPYSANLHGQQCACVARYRTAPPPNSALDVMFIEPLMNLDFSGRHSANHKVHQAISALKIGDKLKLVGREIQTLSGIAVGKCNLP